MRTIYPNAKRYNNKTINLPHFTIYCAWFQRGRNGFAHECYLCPQNLGQYYSGVDGLSKWYNRTWESFEYETCINDAIDKLSDELKELARAEVAAWNAGELAKLDSMLAAFQTNFNSLKDDQKKMIADNAGIVTNEDQFKSVCTITGMLAALNTLTNTEDSNNE